MPSKCLVDDEVQPKLLHDISVNKVYFFFLDRKQFRDTNLQRFFKILIPELERCFIVGFFVVVFVLF